MNTDNIFMERALELARNGLGQVAPNPMVGCVIVHNGKIIGEGWHKVFGGPHAEVNAINSIENKGLLAESTLYVTLEPCSHTGKTPPCSDLLIRHKIKRVVIANTDPNPVVNGGGIRRLEAAGIDVSVGLMSDVGYWMNRRFFTYMVHKRPFYILKWAQTADGFVARKNYDSKWISNTTSRKLVHKWRAEESGILVGFQTANYDDPQLNVRDWQGDDPVRIVLDPRLELPGNLKLFDGSQPTICYTRKPVSRKKTNVEWVHLNDQEWIEQMSYDLYQRGIQSVLVEGGAATLSAFIENGYWDEARVFVGNQVFGEGIPAPHMDKNMISEEMIREDKLLVYKNLK